MKIRLKGQYAKAQAPEEPPSSASQPNGRRAKQQQKAEEQDDEEDEEEQQEEDDDEEEEGAEDQQGGSTSVSSEPDEDYLNAPINDLPESSGDEYFAPPSMSLKPRGRPLGSKNKRRSTRDSESPDNRRPVRSIRASIGSTSERPNLSSTRRSSAAASGTTTVAAQSSAKRGRGRPPGSLNKKGRKPKSRSESLVDEDEDDDNGNDNDDSAMEVEDPDESGVLEEDEEVTSTVQSGTSTPTGRTVYGADGRKRTVAAGASRMKAVRGMKYELGNDELSLPVDPKGEEKVDSLGRLLGGVSCLPATK